uniref:Elongator complex protein 5 n=1 Tax=Nyssomyia neivai TaxID=330878 RepID=A0A1L8DDB0_9DIPT
MLSSVIAQHHQKIILFVDRIGFEEKHWKLAGRALLEDLGAEKMHEDFLEITNHLTDVRESIKFNELTPCGSVVFSPVASICRQYKLEDFFKLIHKLPCSPNVRHIILYATEKYIPEAFVIPFLEHLAEEIVTLEGRDDLKVISRKPGGSVTKKNYKFSIEQHRISIVEVKKGDKVPDALPVNIENLGTFKIGLSDQDLVARNRLILPFEKHLLEKDMQEKKNPGQVIYYPEADDDIDEEDPDDDLEL